MMENRSLKIILLFSVIYFNTSYSQGLDSLSKLKFEADFRFRVEFDRDSRDMDGTYRDDRDRLRIRLRAGFNYRLNQNIVFGARIRTGNSLNQQSANVTLGSGFNSAQISLARAYSKVISNNNLWAWVGKNGMPFWEASQFVWDKDINPEGISVGGCFLIGEKSELLPILGYFVYNHSEQYFKDDGTIYMGQLKFETGYKEDIFIISLGNIYGKELPNIPDVSEVFHLNYNIWASSVVYKRRRFEFKADFIRNFEDYNKYPNIKSEYKDQKNGFSAGVSYTLGKFKFAYQYAHVEKYAVVDYLAQDDYVRWSGTNYTRGSNFKGSEMEIKYNFHKQMNVILRGYFVNGITTTDIVTETGTRVRLDFNIKF